ncbi:alpha/beta fold hydrolase [Terrisporobacter sp.]
MKEYYLKYNNHNICIYENGKGKISIVLLHGAGLDSAMLSWKEVINLLPYNYTVYAIDLLGYGKSDKPKEMSGDLFYKKHIDCLEDIINQLKLDKFILSGISMGGAIAIGYTLKNTEKVKALIPVDSWGLLNKMPIHRLYFWYVNTSITRKLFKYFTKYKWLIKPSVHYSLIEDKSKISKELIDAIYHACLKSNAGKSMEDFQRSSITKYNNIPNFTKALLNINTPILFINGEKDSLVKAKNIIKVSELTPKSSVHIMKKCKHWPQKERPEEYVEVISKFVSEVSK